MPKITSRPLRVVQFRLFEDDYQWLQEQYGDTTGVNKAVRAIISAFRKQVEANAAKEIDALETSLAIGIEP